jgi:ketosteroid isomerase-like protein
MLEQVSKIALAGLDAYASGDVEGMMAVLAEDVEYVLFLDESVVPFAGATRGKDQMRARIGQMHQDFDYVLFRPFGGTVVGNRMHNQVEFIYRHRASGETLSGRFRIVITVGGGFVTHIEEYHDAERIKAFMRLVGGVSQDAAPAAPIVAHRPFEGQAARLHESTEPVAESLPDGEPSPVPEIKASRVAISED